MLCLFLCDFAKQQRNKMEWNHPKSEIYCFRLVKYENITYLKIGVRKLLMVCSLVFSL